MHLSTGIVFTNGCFDILHIGHITLFKACRELGGSVIVGLNSDKSIKRLKGSGRPINCEDDRKKVLMALRYVDDVIIFDEDTPLKLVKSLMPRYLVKGSDYQIDSVVGAEYAESVILVDLISGRSTTSIINKLNNVL